MDVQEYGDLDLRQCRICNRNFRPDVLAKHEPICQKNAKKKRKIFDSGKQRAEGSDVPLNKTIKPGQIPKPDQKLAQAEARTKQWRERHENLVSSLRAARQYAHAKSTGGPLPPPPPPTIDPSLIQCPYCSRRFNEKAFERHSSFCKEQQSRINPKLALIQSKQKPAFKAPLPKTKPAANPPMQKPTVQSNNSQLSSTAKSRSTPTGPSPGISNSRNGPSNSQMGRSLKPASNQPRGSIGSNNSASVPHASKGQLKKPSGPTATSNSSGKSAGFCHECGGQYSMAAARFCAECGVRRLAI